MGVSRRKTQKNSYMLRNTETPSKQAISGDSAA